MGLRGEWWIADESPGGLGEREIWVDDSAIDMIGRGDCDPAIVLRQTDGAAPMDWIGAVVWVNQHPALNVPVVYKIHCRRWSQANDGRPYYVLAWPDLPSAVRERLMAEPVPEPAETRGGENPDWAAVRPGEELPGLGGAESGSSTGAGSRAGSAPSPPGSTPGRSSSATGDDQ